MPWKETCTMDERMKFFAYYLTAEWSMAALCREFGISRKTGYKLLRRCLEEGPSGLADRSRAPHRHRNRVSPEVEQAVIAARRAHRTWGPRKLRAWLMRQDGHRRWPAASTIGEILSRHGLVVPRRRSRKTRPYDQPMVGCDGPNAVWSADLKGWFCTGDGVRCDPLTISDNFSRYLLHCRAVAPATHETIRPLFEAAFHTYGLPRAIRTDNGPPFATTTVGGLSRLSVWWIKLGIMPERIDPGEPAQNGRHERMHRTLKEDTASPPQGTGPKQQQAFDRFRDQYNHERPHEALDMQTPASRYHPSNRQYPLREPQVTYPETMVTRFVKAQGDISWKNQHVYLSQTLAGEIVGLEQVAEHLWDIYFGPIKLAQLETTQKRLIHLPRHPKKRAYK